jgi:hypothetical protein
MIPFLSSVSSIVPQGFGTVAVRAVMSKGAGITWPAVYGGLIYPSLWTVFHLLLGCFISYRAGI